LNNIIIDKATDQKKQADFMSNLDEKERNKAKTLKENINIIDFLIGKEIDRLIDISLFLIPATPNLIDFKEEQAKRRKADKEYNRQIQTIRRKEGTIKIFKGDKKNELLL